ncbi:MAG: phage tail tape measure protein [Candidatus Aminicenantes bacterium]|nr:phage tail tape measure protein [Candidatus Aminicenantes bacterium]NIQ65802.1 phage tail tape measure protein [Candidatus Aminicenantes bacterium]NIT21084.1 phage tail tape measure protein [Candidatus Aminicenantes bacterium]
MPINPPPVKVTFGSVNKLSRTLNTLQAKLGRFGKSTMGVGRTLTTRLALPVALVGAAAIRTAANFEASMNTLGVLTRKQSDRFDDMREMAKKLGAETQFSASQAAEGMNFLAMAGFDANQILAATPGVLNLAAAGNLELAEAADIASNVLTGYGMQANEINRVNDALAFTANNANTNIQMMGESMKFVAPVASGLGIRFEETAAAIGLLGNAGIQASMAGTSLRRAISALAKPTGEAIDVLNRFSIRRKDILDNAGNVKGLGVALDIFKRKGLGATEMMTIFGQRAGPAMIALLKAGAPALAQFEQQIKEGVGEAAITAEAKMKGFNGALKTLKSAMEAVAIAIADAGVLKWLTDFAKSLAEAFRSMSKFHPWVLKIVAVLGMLAIVIPPVLVLLGGLAIAIGAISWPILLIAGGIAALIALGTLLFIKWKAIKTFFVNLWGSLMEIFRGPIGLILGALFPFVTIPLLIIANWKKVVSFFKSAGGFLKGVAKGIGGFFGMGGDEGEGVTAAGIRGLTVGAREAGRSVQEITQQQVTKGQADVNIKFQNVPPGTRVDTDNKGVNLNQDLGFVRSQ